VAHKNLNSGLTTDILAGFGLQVKQDETFGYELKDSVEQVG
jgi:hypothetical protein